MAAVLFAKGQSAFAQSAADGASPDHFLYFGGVDLWRAGGFVNGGLLWSPRGIDNEGFTLKLLMAGGSYQYLSGTNEITGRMGLAAVMPGWRTKSGGLDVLVYVGPEVQFHRLSPDDIGNRLRNTHAGARAGVDIWAEPTDMTMASFSVSTSTIGTSYWTRAAVGWRVFDSAWIGPEVGALGDTEYRQLRFGAHLTGLHTQAIEWSFGAGYVNDSDHRAGAYGHIGFIVRQ